MIFGSKFDHRLHFLKSVRGARPVLRLRAPFSRFSAVFDDTTPVRPAALLGLRTQAASWPYVAPAATHPSRRAHRRYNACSGKAELSRPHTRRTLTVTLAATFKSRVRIVPTVACASSLPCNPTRRNRYNSRYARVASQSRN
jgi:hypothetical protein